MKEGRKRSNAKDLHVENLHMDEIMNDMKRGRKRSNVGLCV